MECAKQFEITISAFPPIVFLWGIPTETVTGVGTAVFTPNNTTGNAAVGSTTDTNGGVGELSNAANTSTVVISTTAVVPCNMHIKVTYVGPGLGVDFGSSWNTALFNLTMGGPNIVFEEGNAGFIGNMNAEYDVPFNLPNTGGVNQMMEWDVNALCGDGVGTPSSVLVEATFTVL